MTEATIIYQDRILTNADLARKEPDFAAWFGRIGIDPEKYTLSLASGKLLIIDPIYLADIFNQDNAKAQYLKRNGVLLTDFGGDVSGPVFRTRGGGLKVLLVFDRVDQDVRPIFRPETAGSQMESEVNSEDLGCDSGSYIFLDFGLDLRTLFEDELRRQRLFVVDLSPGRYAVAYERWETNADNPYEAWRRNLVVWPIR